MLLEIGQGSKRSGDLVDLLLECHGRIRSFLALAHAAGSREGVPAAEVAEACARVERYFTEALPLHVADEDESILPRLRGADPEVDRALETMHAQHLEHEPLLAALLGAAAALREGPADPARRAALAEIATTLEHELGLHLTLEETVILPAIRRLLSAAAQAEIVEELRARRQREPR
jgi:hemerythrin-like domain-containing protein